ncbi:hypothetical protein [Curtobacterium sp. 20TX0008]|uniref:hypothetical protein n=1 Tax=Curtobacterium sp. 20TX0008 TaxID=3022018 RepID=UPI002330503E|nr:hypothetical protein [Curtobacterium sp. 20TX0008]MDB6427443.1 hypothetical protein [Curtobacterium sp. 20TX0008]
MTDDGNRPTVVRASAYACTALDALQAASEFDDIKGQDVYAALGELKSGVGDRLPTSLRNLVRSLDAYDVREDDGSDPALAIAKAADHLGEAATMLELVWDRLEQAQTALRGQSAHQRPDRTT